MKILVGADVVPTECNIEKFVKGDAISLVGEKLKNILDDADYRIFNLELALSDKDTPIRKAGPNISAPTSTINGIKALKADLLGIANNHILDHGYEGFVSTLKTLDDAKISHVGGGFSKDEARKPFYFTKDDKKIGVYACCEHEFSWVSDYGFGANGFDALVSLDEITNAKSNCDFLIVLYHGGKEHYQYPSPYLRKVCRKIVEKGADFVVCQHTHCIGTEEDYKGGKIVYGQGNFIFSKNYGDVDTWYKGVLVLIDITTDGNVNYSYIPYEMTSTGIAYSKNAEEILNQMKRRSEEIKQDGFIEKKFAELADSIVEWRYIQHMVGHHVDDEFIKERGIALFHFAECEVHKECLMTGLRKRLKLGIYGETEELK